MSHSVSQKRLTAQNAGYVFAYFCGGHRNNFWLQFRSSFKGISVATSCLRFDRE